MSTMTAIEAMPYDLQVPMLKVLDAFQRDLREQLAVRREDFDKLQATVAQLARSQDRTEQSVAELVKAQQQNDTRFNRLDVALAELAEAQKRTETRMEELTEVQRQGEARFNRLDVALAELTEAQKQTELSIKELNEAQKQTELSIKELNEAQKQTELSIKELNEAQKQTEFSIKELNEAQKRSEILWQQSLERQNEFDIGFNRSLGRQLEVQYRDKAHAYFGRVLRKVEVVSVQALEEAFESRLDDREWEDVSLLDLIVRGQATQHAQRPSVFLALEISAVIDRGDVERSLRRSARLRKVGFPVVSGVAGEDITRGAMEMAQREHVFVVQNGHKDFWEEALAAALAT
jgi:chromosome segregation ATPase